MEKITIYNFVFSSLLPKMFVGFLILTLRWNTLKNQWNIN